MSLPILPPVVESLPENGEGPRDYNANYIFYWNNVALDLVRLTHTNGGHQNGPPLTARFLGIFHLAMHDAYFDVFPYSYHPNAKPQFVCDFEPYLPKSDLNEKRPSTLQRNAARAKEAVGGAAITVLNKLFKNPDKRDGGVSQTTLVALSDFIDSSVRVYRQTHHVTLHSPAYNHGVEIAKLILRKLETRAREDGVDAGSYAPNAGQPYWFDDDPSHPLRLQSTDPNDPEDGERVTRPYHAPYYARTAAVLATTRDIKIADPPVIPFNPPMETDCPSPEHLKYLESLEDVHRMGGAEELATTKRRPTQTARGLFWAYDGVNLIGTPPRLYNQIVKQIAFDKKMKGALTSDENNAEFIRLLALVNVAMADAGIFCWRDKYKYELWRPLTGVRADPTGPVPDGHSRPTWRVLGAPATNGNQGGFKPPFPAYPSGHATFGAAAFQMVRLFYHQRGDMLLEDIEHGRADPQKSDPQIPEAKKTNPEKNNPDQNGQKKTEAPMLDQGKAADTNDDTNDGKKKGTKVDTNEDSCPVDKMATQTQVDQRSANDSISFTFTSDELNGISRTLSQPYTPSKRIQDQSGDVRTRVPIKFASLKEAIFSNAMSRIWLGVHWNFDAFAGETVCEPYDPKCAEGQDKNLPLPDDYQQLFKVETDGSTMYKDVKKMDWFAEASQGPRTGCGENEKFPVGGVPMGMMIADDIFGNRMRLVGVLSRSGDVLDSSFEHSYCTSYH
jgi:vanadium chloroperoxidase